MKKAFAVIGASETERLRVVRYDRAKADEAARLLIEFGYEPLIKEFEAVRTVRGELV